MRFLMIDAEVVQQLNRLRNYAEKHPLSTQDLKEIKEAKKPPVGDDENYSIVIPDDFRIVYSLEEHPACTARHVSVSVPGETRTPNFGAMRFILEKLQFKNTDVRRISEGLLWLEPACNGRGPAVNVLEPVL